LSPIAHIKLRTAEHIKFHRFSLSPSNLLLLLFTTCCTAPTSHSMASEADQTPRIVVEPVVDENKSDSETESNVLAASSFSNVATTKMVEKTIP
jgi:hypothetical protein